jgi:hypothetical protein
MGRVIEQPPGRFYTLTPAGRKQLVVERKDFDRLMVAIHKVLNAV